MTTEPLDIFQSDLRPMPYWTVRAQDKLDIWRQGKPEGSSTGFKSVDGWLRLLDTQLTTIAARPSQGKTSLGMQIVENVGRALRDEGEPGVVAVFSAEMAGWELAIRMASALSGVNAHQLRMGKGTKEEIDLMEAKLSEIKDLPIWIDDNTGPTTAQMLSQLAELNETNPVRLMLFDFMELGGDRAKQEDLRIGQIAHNLKGIAKTLQIPVIALSQINRSVDERANKMPTLSDLRYSGMIEQISDNVIFIMRPEYYIERQQQVEAAPEDRQGVAYIQFAKNRWGPVGMTKLAFIKNRSMFAELERSPEI